MRFRLPNTTANLLIGQTTETIKRIYTGTKYLAATGTHRIYLSEWKKYLPVDSLKTGMKLLSLSGALLAIDSITTVSATTPIYDISVTGVHNYYAGEVGVLVHDT